MNYDEFHKKAYREGYSNFGKKNLLAYEEENNCTHKNPDTGKCMSQYEYTVYENKKRASGISKAPITKKE